MELVDGDAQSPTLISNLEVMQLLKKNIDQRAKNDKKKRKSNKRFNRFRHRDWVEEEVYRYVKSTPCAKLDPARREEFHSKLKGNKRLRRASIEANGKAGSMAEAASSTIDKMEESEEKDQQQSSKAGFDLTEAEALQIMNMMPTEPVEIHLMVDELQSRMSDTRQEEFLEFISSYATGQQEVALQDQSEEAGTGKNGHGQGQGQENGKLPAVNVKREQHEESKSRVI